jgi:hypothetical protein
MTPSPEVTSWTLLPDITILLLPSCNANSRLAVVPAGIYTQQYKHRKT